MNKPLPRTLLLTAVAGLLAACGYWLMFTQFMVYDDEGYVLSSLRDYFAHGGLYTRVYSQYGPFLYVLYHALHAGLGLAFDNATGRLVTLFYWCAASGLAGVFVWRQTRSTIATAAAGVLTFGALLIMINEPIHPGGLLAFLSALGAVGGAWAIERGHHRFFAALAGAIAAAMLLTKVNVGAFFLIAAGSWLALAAPRPRLARASLWLAAVGSLLLPLWLMQKLWPAPWVATFCLVFSAAALSLLCLLQAGRTPARNWQPAIAAAAAAVTVSLLVLGAAWARGTSLAGLWHGIVVAPLRQPMVYAHPVNWPAVVPVLSVLLLGFAAWHHTRPRPWHATAVAVLRWVALVGFLLVTPHVIENRLVFTCFQFGPAVAWLMAVPLTGASAAPSARARSWVAWVFIWQTLHAYPVAGSQMGWGAFLVVPLAIVGAHEAVTAFAARRPAWRRGLLAGAMVLLGAGAVVVLAIFTRQSTRRYFHDEPLGLHGTGSLRLTEDMTSLYRILDDNIRTHGNLLFSYPGMFSLNIWTGRPAPTTANVTHWFSLLDDDQQAAIIDRLEHDPRAVVVVQSYLINYLVYHGYPPRGPLQHYLVEHFAPAFRVDTFEFWVHRGRTVAPLSTATLAEPDAHGVAELQLVTAAHAAAARIEIRGLFYPHNVVALVAASPARPWRITPLNADDHPAGPVQSAPGPVALAGISRIQAELHLGGGRLPPLDLLEVVLLAADGSELDRLRFTH